jgi:DNA-directed RNA polymerase subunit RPC12/RpoP
MKAEFICAECGFVFEQISSDEHVDAEHEYEDLGFVPGRERVVLCHDCWIKFMERIESKGWMDPKWRKYR